jgi:hypothetical protein
MAATIGFAERSISPNTLCPIREKSKSRRAAQLRDLANLSTRCERLHTARNHAACKHAIRIHARNFFRQSAQHRTLQPRITILRLEREYPHILFG